MTKKHWLFCCEIAPWECKKGHSLALFYYAIAGFINAGGVEATVKSQKIIRNSGISNSIQILSGAN